MKHRKPTRYLYFLVFSLIIGLSGNAQAKCTAADLPGVWFAHVFFVDETTTLGSWTRCKLKLNSKGRFNTTNSSCVVDTGERLFIAGRFTGKSSCNLNPVRINFFDTSGDFVRVSIIDFGNLDKGKTVISGVGDKGTDFPFIFTAIKR